MSVRFDAHEDVMLVDGPVDTGRARQGCEMLIYLVDNLRHNARHENAQTLQIIYIDGPCCCSYCCSSADFVVSLTIYTFTN